MFNILDFIFFGLLILAMIHGWRLGLIKSLSGLFALAAAFVMGIWYASTLSDFLEYKWNVTGSILSWLLSHISLPVLPIDSSLFGLEAELLGENAFVSLASLLSLALSFAIIAILFYIAVNLIFAGLYKLISVSFIKHLDGFLGLVFQAAKFLLFFTIILGFAYDIFHTNQLLTHWHGQRLVAVVDGSICGDYLLPVYYQLKTWGTILCVLFNA